MGNQKKRRSSAGSFLIPVSTLTKETPIENTVQAPIQQLPQQLVSQPFPPQPPPQQGGMDGFSQLIMALNGNPYVIGVFMLFLNLGGRFLALELTKKQEEFMQQRWVRPLLFFTVIFIATRNLAAAFWITLLFFFLIWVVANEHSPFCLIPSWCGSNSDAESSTYVNNIKKLLGTSAE